MMFRELFFWSVVILGAIVARFVGSCLGRRLGARHVMGWFGALTGFTIATILLNVAERPEMVLRDLREGLLAACLIYGPIVALCVEVTLTIVEISFRSWKSRQPVDSTGWLSAPRFRARDLVVTGVVICVMIYAYYFTFAPILNHKRPRRQVEVAILKLATKRPEGVSTDQWASCVHWTWNLHGNCGFYPAFPTDKLQRFADELDRKLKRGVNMSTIDWIWDEYVRHAGGGNTYSDKYRPTAPKRLREVDVYGWTGSPLKHFIEEYDRECQKKR